MEMKKTEKIMKAAEISAAAKNASAYTHIEAKALNAERKTLLATITFLSKSESNEAACWRDFWGIKPNANAKDRRALVARIESSYQYYKEVYSISAGDESDEVVVVKTNHIVPCTSTGRVITDFLQVLKSAKIREEKRRGVMAILKESARDENGNIKFELLPKNVQTYLDTSRVCMGFVTE